MREVRFPPPQLAPKNLNGMCLSLTSPVDEIIYFTSNSSGSVKVHGSERITVNSIKYKWESSTSATISVSFMEKWDHGDYNTTTINVTLAFADNTWGYYTGIYDGIRYNPGYSPEPFGGSVEGTFNLTVGTAPIDNGGGDNDDDPEPPVQQNDYAKKDMSRYTITLLNGANTFLIAAFDSNSSFEIREKSYSPAATNVSGKYAVDSSNSDKATFDCRYSVADNSTSLIFSYDKKIILTYTSSTGGTYTYTGTCNQYSQELKGSGTFSISQSPAKAIAPTNLVGKTVDILSYLLSITGTSAYDCSAKAVATNKKMSSAWYNYTKTGNNTAKLDFSVCKESFSSKTWYDYKLKLTFNSSSQGTYSGTTSNPYLPTVSGSFTIE